MLCDLCLPIHCVAQWRLPSTPPLRSHGDMIYMEPRCPTSPVQGAASIRPGVQEDEVDQALSKKDGKIHRPRDPHLWVELVQLFGRGDCCSHALQVSPRRQQQMPQLCPIGGVLACPISPPPPPLLWYMSFEVSLHLTSLSLQPFDSAYLASRDPPIKFLSFHSYLHKLTSGIDKYCLTPQLPCTALTLPSAAIEESL